MKIFCLVWGLQVVLALTCGKFRRLLRGLASYLFMVKIQDIFCVLARLVLTVFFLYIFLSGALSSSVFCEDKDGQENVFGSWEEFLLAQKQENDRDVEDDLDLSVEPFSLTDRGENLVAKAIPVLYEAVKRVYPDSHKDFFEAWNIQEVIRFLNSFNHFFLRPKRFLSKSAKKKRVKGFIPIFSEIFEGVRQFKEAPFIGDDVFFVSEFLLDPEHQFKLSTSEFLNRHDGVTISIKGSDIYIYRISEAKEGGKYKASQGHGVYERWSKEGIYIYDRRFTPEHIFLMLDDNESNVSGKKIVNISETSFEDFQSITEVGGTNFKQDIIEHSRFKGSFFDIAKIVGGQKRIERVGKEMVLILDRREKSVGLSSMYVSLNNNLIISILNGLFDFVDTYKKLPGFDSKSIDEKLLRLSLYFVLYTPTDFTIDSDIQVKFRKKITPLVLSEGIYAPNMERLAGDIEGTRCSRFFYN